MLFIKQIWIDNYLFQSAEYPPQTHSYNRILFFW